MFPLKKRALPFLLCAALIPTLAHANAQQTPPKLYLNGKQIGLDTPPIIQNERTLVPLRLVSEELGFDVEWNEEAQQIIISREEPPVLAFEIGNTNYGIGDMTYTIEAPPVILNDRTYVPVRAIAEAFNIPLTWDPATRSVIFGERPKTEPEEIPEEITPEPTPQPQRKPAPKKQTGPIGQGRIKGNRRSKIYHLPGSNHYDKVSPQNTVYFETEAQAKQAGYRPSKSRN